jgi:hypothetical protein
MAGKPHSGYSSYRAWEVALYFDNDRHAYDICQRQINTLAWRAEKNPEKFITMVTNRLCSYFEGSYIPDTRTPISRRSILEYVKGEAAELLNRPELCKVYED